MDPLLKAALVGTSQYNPEIAATGTGVDTLAERIPAAGGEQKVLLSAGARSIYQLAGYTAVALAAPEMAPEETLPACSPETAALVKQVLESGEDEVQIVLFKRLRQAGLRLAPELLPTVLEMRDQTKRDLLYPLLGQRGVWLSRHNPAWSWVGETANAAVGSLPADAETLWQEGTTAQRLEVLRRLRVADPQLARQWIEATWKREKAELRTELVRMLAAFLSAEDEPLLERALDDKAASVRTAAAEILRRLTTSALAQRMRERAQAMLTYAKGALKVTPPGSLDASWQRDGIAAKVIKGDRTVWFMQVLSSVPPAHWEERFDLSAEALIALASETKWEPTLLEGWTRAAATFGGDSWLVPLGMYWSGPAKNRDRRQRAGEMYTLLGPLLPPSLQEEIAIRLIQAPDAAAGPSFSEVISSVGQPWSVTLGEEYLRGLQAFVSGLTGKSTSMDPWDESLAVASTALPADILSAACEPLVVPGDKHNWYTQQFQRELDGFQNTMRLRARIEKEISL